MKMQEFQGSTAPERERFSCSDSPHESPLEDFPPYPAQENATAAAPSSTSFSSPQHASSKKKLNGNESGYYPPEEPSSPSKSNNSHGISTPKISNIKIKKQYSKIYRIKTKILQNLGKADKTTDELFNDYEVNFNKQQLNANRLHKEISNYLRCARALHGASKALFETLAEVYEPEWVGHDLIYVQAQNSDMLWTDFCHKLQDQTLAPLTVYAQDFPEIRKKIDKRGRKLVDYDSQRHQLENLQRSNRRDEYKITRVKDQLENARSTYETLNKDLYDELPTIYDERIPNTANALQTLFAAEATFMQESSKISLELEAISEKLSRECSKGTYKTHRGSPPKSSRPLSASTHSPSSPRSPTVWYEAAFDSPSKAPQELPPFEAPRVTKEETAVLNGGTKNGAENDLKPTLPCGSDPDDLNDDHDNTGKPSTPTASPPATPPPPPTLPVESPPRSPSSPTSPSLPTSAAETDLPLPPPQSPRKKSDSNRDESGRNYEEIQFEDKKFNGTHKVNGDVSINIPPGATTEGLPPGVLYRVKATYKYVREDVDELGFDVGEIIDVVEYDDPEEQEEGWLCGIKESSTEKGLFPANFTRPI